VVSVGDWFLFIDFHAGTVAKRVGQMPPHPPNTVKKLIHRLSTSYSQLQRLKLEAAVESTKYLARQTCAPSRGVSHSRE
jgi:hypothetical protein